MTAVDFHSGVADKLAYACRLLRKAHRAGEPVAVLGSPAELARLDQLLWIFDPDAFIPHARLRSGASVPARLARTPIWLVDALQDLPAGRSTVVVNLGPDAAPVDGQLQRLIEIVARDESEVASGRARWRLYKAAGWSLRNHAQDGT